MQLSIIIVNYNVKYFLEQCLCAVEAAMGNEIVEVIVNDNNSTDGSCEYLPQKFPWVQFIWSNQNTGFAKANNHALQFAKGEYILFLNPDTIIAENTLQVCMNWLQQHADAGAVGVKMIDGSGNFLPESKRGFPSPAASFFKLSGLIKLFPHSKKIAAYYMGHLNENENNVVDVLPGAYMMVRKKILDDIGGFDEQFFMYAEDIDLSYRIQQAGYKNYYLATNSIIHFKGESTASGTLSYVKLFYKAMRQFVAKHYAGAGLWGFRLLLSTAIWLRASVEFIKRLIPTPPIKNVSKPTKIILLGDENDEVIINNIIKKNNILVEELKRMDSLKSFKEAANAFNNNTLIISSSTIKNRDMMALLAGQKITMPVYIHQQKSSSMVSSASKKNSGKSVGF